jgi:hypothetical protein
MRNIKKIDPNTSKTPNKMPQKARLGTVGYAVIACAFITKWRKNVFALDNKNKK